MAYEVDCDVCGGHAEGWNCKQVCIHCFNRVVKENIKLKKKLTSHNDTTKNKAKESQDE